MFGENARLEELVLPVTDGKLKVFISKNCWRSESKKCV